MISISTIKQAAIKALNKLGKVSRTEEIYSEIIESQLYKFGAKEPLHALNVELMRHSKGVNFKQKGKEQVFYKDGPMSYGLLTWLNTNELSDLVIEEELLGEVYDSSLQPNASLLDTSLFLEEEWHQWLYKNLRENGLIGLGFGKLRLFDEKQNERIGKYNTKIVGEIDLLLVSESNEIIVIELKRKASDETVGQICRYVGWVEEELAKSGQKVYGIIIAQNIDEKLRYAIKPLKDHIYYQQLTFTVEFGESSKKSS
ncbi:endonuclease NucS domain-containing protein [Ureibacillus acetophenoni]